MPELNLSDWNVSQAINAAIFVMHNKIKNENNRPIEFNYHRFLTQPYVDFAPRIVVRKASQVGFTTLAAIRAFHLAYYQKANIIYCLPSRTIIKDLVRPKIGPLIENNDAIKRLISDKTDDMVTIGVDDPKHIYFKSAWDENTAISTSAHILIVDEYDRSNPIAVNTYKTRLDYARAERPDLGWQWYFSNPTRPGHGTDELWERSDKKVWMSRCSRCTRHQYMEWPDNINLETEEYICSYCHRPLSMEDRVKGQWVPMKLGSNISGYWMNQMMVAWHPASKIIEDSKGDQSVFHNFTLGKPYQHKDQAVSRPMITQCITPTLNTRTNVAMGVDVGKVKHYVIGNREGIFRIGTTTDWQEIEDLRNQYNAYAVIDAMPNPDEPAKLAKKYHGKVFINYYSEDSKGVSAIRWGEDDKYGVVLTDRTKIIDAVVADFNSRDQLFNLDEEELGEYIEHWLNMFRVADEQRSADGALTGVIKPVWKHNDGKPDHFCHATVYFKIALEKTISQGTILKPEPLQPFERRPHVVTQSVPGYDINKLKQQLRKGIYKR